MERKWFGWSEVREVRRRGLQTGFFIYNAYIRTGRDWYEIIKESYMITTA